MLVIINAFKSISRSKGRNILIGIIVLAIAASSCIALAIRNAADDAEAVGLESVSITGTISVDRQKLIEENGGGGRGDMSQMRELMERYKDLELDELLIYSDSAYVKDFNYSSSTALNATGELKAYGSEDNADNDSDNVFVSPEGGMVARGGGPGGGGGGMRGGRAIMVGRALTIGDFTVTGYSSEEAMTKFMNSTASIKEGEMFDIASDDMTCLISDVLAYTNGLSVGDSIVLANPNYDSDDEDIDENGDDEDIANEDNAEDNAYGENAGEYTFTIVGIYTDTSSGEVNDMPMFSTAQDPANLICVSYPSLSAVIENSIENEITGTDDWGTETTTALTDTLSSSFIFADKGDYDSFTEELTAKGLSEYYVLTSSNLNNYESSVIPLRNLSAFATTMLFIILAIGAVILVVINVFNIRERKYEVGVLTAIGIKKGKVAMQFVTELLCVTLSAIIIGTVVGAVISVPVSNNLLATQIERAEDEALNQAQSFGRPGGGPISFDGGGGGGRVMSFSSFGGGENERISYLETVNASVNLMILAQLILIGIGLTLVSSLAAVIFVMRYEPLKILANRA
ncbi:MAG: ABC transporter permease [Oscillospiraceae bacterium]|nr:ABC transporter permease [Oscillospiraceae bacterium]